MDWQEAEKILGIKDKLLEKTLDHPLGTQDNQRVTAIALLTIALELSEINDTLQRAEDKHFDRVR